MTTQVRFVYFSTATQDMNDQDLSDLLSTCRRNNEKKGISGLLVYHDRNFLQVLEGERDALYELLGVIEADPRHTGLTAVLEEQVEGRAFGEWSMGYQPVNAGDNLIDHMLNLRDAFPASVQASIFQSKTLPFLRAFYKSTHAGEA